jgi:hypothetical protein
MVINVTARKIHIKPNISGPVRLASDWECVVPSKASIGLVLFPHLKTKTEPVSKILYFNGSWWWIKSQKKGRLFENKMHCRLTTGDTAGMCSNRTVVEILTIATTNVIEFILLCLNIQNKLLHGSVQQLCWTEPCEWLSSYYVFLSYSWNLTDISEKSV